MRDDSYGKIKANLSKFDGMIVPVITGFIGEYKTFEGDNYIADDSKQLTQGTMKKDVSRH